MAEETEVVVLRGDASLLEKTLAEVKRLEGEVTDEERKLAKAMKDLEAAATKRAQSLGLTVGQLRQMEAAQSKATAAVAKHGSEVKKTGETWDTFSGGLEKGLKAFGGPVGEITDTLFDLAEGFGGVASAGALVTAGAAAGLLAWRAYALEEERVARITGEVRVAHEALDDILLSTRRTTIDLQEETGKLSERQAELARNSLDAWEALNQATAPARERIAELRKEQGALTTQLVDMGEAWSRTTVLFKPGAMIFDALTTSSEEMEEEIGILNRTVADSTAAVRDNLAVTNELTDAKGRNAGATRRQIEAEVDFETQVVELRERVADRERERRAAIQKSYEEDIAEQQAIFAKMEEEQTRKHEEEVAKRLEESRRAAEEERRLEQLKLSSTADLFGAVSDIARIAQEGMTEEQREAAMTLFYIQQAAALGQATINAALGVSQAAASAPPPYNALPMAAAVAQGAANVAAVLAVPPPTFNDTPGVVSLGQRQLMSFGSGDHVAAARDPQELKRQVDSFVGGDPHADYRDGGPSVAVVGARAFGRRVRDDVRLRTPLQRAIFSSDGPTGQRGRR